MLVYIAGKYSADTQEGIQQNIDKAKAVAQELWDKGYAVICPHTNTAHFEQGDAMLEKNHVGTPKWEQYLSGDEEMILRCDAVIMLDNWTESRGATREFEYATRNGIPTYFYPQIPEFYKAENESPTQVEAFMRELMQMYRVHLQKNSDYSPANIEGTGEIGLVTRMWDKMARLMNLTGFRIKVKNLGFEKPTQPKNESIDDTLIDNANYSIIYKLWRRGEWGC